MSCKYSGSQDRYTINRSWQTKTVPWISDQIATNWQQHQNCQSTSTVSSVTHAGREALKKQVRCANMMAVSLDWLFHQVLGWFCLTWLYTSAVIGLLSYIFVVFYVIISTLDPLLVLLLTKLIDLFVLTPCKYNFKYFFAFICEQWAMKKNQSFHFTINKRMSCDATCLEK